MIGIERNDILKENLLNLYWRDGTDLIRVELKTEKKTVSQRNFMYAKNKITELICWYI